MIRIGTIAVFFAQLLVIGDAKRGIGLSEKEPDVKAEQVELGPAPPGDDRVREKPDFFWYNKATGESAWESPFPIEHKDSAGNVFMQDPHNVSHTWWAQEPPAEWAWEEMLAEDGDHKGQTYYHNKVTGESVWEPPASHSWKKMSAERVFYYNQVTGQSQHERPKEMGFWSEEHNRTFWTDEETGEATWESKYWWTEVPVDVNEAGNTNGATKYYFNEVTKESSWDLPADLAWVQWHEEL